MMTTMAPTEGSPVSDAYPTRRRVLQLTGAGTVSALAGCAWILPGSTATVIEDLTFQGTSVVVHLPDDTAADAIDLRSPSGELLHTASIGRQSTVELSLYKYTLTPYLPGTYMLVAVDTSGSEPQTLDKQSLDLTSSLSVADVRPIKEPDTSFYRKIRVSTANTGTLPVSIEYIGFPTGVPAPNPPPSATPPNGSQYVSLSDTGHIVPVEGQVTFESGFYPLWSSGASRADGAVGVPNDGASWQQVTTNHCNGEQHPATLVVPGHGPTYRLTVTFKYAGCRPR
jgi:hypothetical protein